MRQPRISLSREDTVRFLANKSLQTRLILTGSSGVIIVVLAAMTFSSTSASGEAASVAWLRFLYALTVAGFMSVAVVTLLVRSLLRPLKALPAHIRNVIDGSAESSVTAGADTPEFRELKSAVAQLARELDTARKSAEASRTAHSARVDTVDRLLDFSQTIQGAGKPEQIYQTLCHYLRGELGLAGIVALTHEPESVPTTQVRASWPEDAMSATGDHLALELETSLCPCLRQNLPRHFRADGSPVRCGIDRVLRFDATHSAFCVPFNIGGKSNVLVHMLLPPGQEWTEDRKQLAQTYVNTAHSALISLHLLSEAEKQSMTDSLTALYNRRSLDSLMQREVALAERHKLPLSLVMIDMDKFKEVNDAHGHAAGDHLLKSFADCVRITLRKTDLAFRYGGDEFVIALPQTTVAQAKQVVNKLRQAFAAVDFSDAISNLGTQPTLSIGVAERSPNGNVLTLASLLAAADQALYEAKNNNRNCVRVYQPPQAA